MKLDPNPLFKQEYLQYGKSFIDTYQSYVYNKLGIPGLEDVNVEYSEVTKTDIVKLRITSSVYTVLVPRYPFIESIYGQSLDAQTIRLKYLLGWVKMELEQNSPEVFL